MTNAAQRVEYNERLIEAAMNNNTPEATKWIALADLEYAQYEALGWSLRNNNAATVTALVQKATVEQHQDVVYKFLHFDALSVDVLKIFVDFVQYSTADEEIAQTILRKTERCVKEGECSAVRYLIAHCDPKTDNSRLLRIAAQFNKLDIVDILYPVSDPQAAVQFMTEELKLNLHHTQAQARISLGKDEIHRRIRQEELRADLIDAVGGIRNTEKLKKKM